MSGALSATAREAGTCRWSSSCRFFPCRIAEIDRDQRESRRDHRLGRDRGSLGCPRNDDWRGGGHARPARAGRHRHDHLVAEGLMRAVGKRRCLGPSIRRRPCICDRPSGCRCRTARRHRGRRAARSGPSPKSIMSVVQTARVATTKWTVPLVGTAAGIASSRRMMPCGAGSACAPNAHASVDNPASRIPRRFIGSPKHRQALHRRWRAATRFSPTRTVKSAGREMFWARSEVAGRQNRRGGRT